MTAARLEVHTGDRRCWIIVCSAYLPYDSIDPPPTRELRDLIRTADAQALHIVIGCDANAHHTTWGSTNNNRRGEYLFDYLLTTNLVVANCGDEPTFDNGRRREVLDLTLASRSISDAVTGWRVSREPSCSDHRLIMFNIGEWVRQNTEYVNPRNANWVTFKEVLNSGISGIMNTIRSPQDIELATDLINDSLLTALRSSCPVTVRSHYRDVPWWNENLTKLRATARRLFNSAKRGGSWEVYRHALTTYNRELRKAKRVGWRNFCQSVEGARDSARLHKTLMKTTSGVLGSLRKSDGSYTQTREETLGVLLQAHFPGTVIEEDSDTIMPRLGDPSIGRASKEDWRLASSVFSLRAIKDAIFSFEPFKSPGTDGIYPVLLQKGYDILVHVLCKLFRASFALGYIPAAWRSVKVAFIPKQGRPDYALAKAYRPISLSSFLLKTMEKVIDRVIRERYLTHSPLHTRQHAYQAGKSTITALHDLVHRLEGAVFGKEIAVATFLDIEGAFDNTSFDVITRALRGRDLSSTFCRWIDMMLRSRKLTASLLGGTLRGNVARGCPQGGVLSPLLWCLVIDELLVRLNEGNLFAQGYADDIVIVTIGDTGTNVSVPLQRALDTVADWCQEVDLKVNPDKTVLVPFTRKRNLEGLTEPIFSGTTLTFTDQVKYLGITLDSKLYWNLHLDTVAEKARKSFWACRRACGTTWGLKPKTMFWIYTSVIRPMITYGAITWWHRAKLNSVRTKLSGIQRMACLSITGAMRTSPSAALETLLNLTPLHLEVEGVAISTAYRLEGAGLLGTNIGKGHSTIREVLVELPELTMVSDRMPTRSSTLQKPFIKMESREDWTFPSIPRGGLVWYTDGSKTDSGVGVGVWGESPRVCISQSLGKYATVFQAEVFAILTCAYENLRRAYKCRNIFIFSDSQAAIKAIGSSLTSSKLVWECQVALDVLCGANRVNLIWIPGHRGLVGNEKADELARRGSDLTFIGPEPSCGIPLCVVKGAIRNRLFDKHRTYWRDLEGQLHSKSLMAAPMLSRTRELLGQSRSNVRLITGLITGHCHLKKHLERIGRATDPVCRLCLEEDETPLHILCECPAIARRRFSIFGKSSLDPRELGSIPLHELLNLFKGTGLV